MQTLADLPAAAQQAISAAIGQDQSAYHVAADAAGVTLANPANGFAARWQSGALHISAGLNTWDMSLNGLGYGGAVQPVGTAQTSVHGNRVDCNYGAIDEWYVNGPGGLEQGFAVAPLPPSDATGPLTVELALGGDLWGTVNAAGNGLVLCRPDGSAALGYTGLVAYDATGKTLPAWLEVRAEGGRQDLLIHVDDAGAQGLITIDPFVQQAKLTASDGAAGDYFGNSVSISGNTLVVGAFCATVGANMQQGAAYVFTESGSGWTNIIQTAKLTASDGAANDWFGYSVSVSGDTVVVGAEYAKVGANSEQGAAYVFTEPGSGWANMTQTAKLTVSQGAANDIFGFSVAISGNTVVGGAPNARVSGTRGAAYVFTEPGSGWANMTQTAEVYTSDGVAIGNSVAISGNTVVVGAPGAKVGANIQQGAAYVYTEPGSGWVTMTQTARLIASDGAASDELGSSVSISGDTVVVGAQYAKVGTNGGQGAAYVYTEPGSSWANMTQTAKLTASDGAMNNNFGMSVSISGNTVVVGAWKAMLGAQSEQGAAYVFTEPASGWADMTQTAKLTAFDGARYDHFGTSVSISGDTVVVGARSATAIERYVPGPGASYVFGPPAAASAVSTTAAANSRYTVGGTVPITVTFSEAIHVSGTPQLTLNDGGVANYTGGSGTATLSFSYVVGVGQNTLDLDYASTGALGLNGGSIQDLAGNAAVLTLPATGTDGLAAQHIVVDGRATPTITWATPTSIRYGTPLSSAQLNASASVDGTYSYSIVSGTVLNAGVQALSVTFAPDDTADYVATSAHVNLIVTKAPLTVTADDRTKVYGGTDPSLSYTPSGTLYNGDQYSVISGVTLSTATGSAANAGTHAITASGGAAANYAIGYVDGSLTVAPATLTITANNASKAYGSADPVFSASAVGFVPGEGPSNLGGMLGFITNEPTTGAAAVGSYRITPSGLTSGNYAVTYADGTLVVTPGIIAPTLATEGTALSLSGSVSTSAINYAWNVTRNGNFFVRGSGSNVTLTPNDQGTYVATLTGPGNDGSSVSVTRTISVTDVPPTAAISGPGNGTEGTAIKLTGSATDPSIVDATAGFTYRWNITKDGNLCATSSGGSLSFTPNDQGSYAVTLIATDKDDSSLAATRTIAVTNVAPTATISKLGNVTEGMTVTLTGSATDPSSLDTGAVVALAWTLSKNSALYATANGPALTFTPDDNGSYVATLTATDKDGGVGTATRALTVADVPPTAAVSGPTGGSEGAPITLTGSATDPSSVDVASGFTCTWTVTRNGAFYMRGSGPSVTVAPNDQGTYVATLTASDKDGSGTVARTIVVSNVAPTASLSNNGPVAAGSTAVVTLSAGCDPSSLDTTAGLRYAYDFDNNGTFEVGNGAYAGSVTVSSATVPASYLATPGTRVVHARIIDKDGGYTDYTTSITVGSPLLAQDVATVGAPEIVGRAAAQSLLVAAISRWSAAGVDVSVLRNAQVRVADLSGAVLGLASAADHTIWLDINAAGHGWFIDPAPQWDEEFVRQATGDWLAQDAQAAHGMDLLTVISHELGHLLGRPDLAPDAHADNLMDATLGDGIRRLPSADSSRTAWIGTPQSAPGAELLNGQLQARDDLFAGWDDGSDGLFGGRTKRFKR